MKKLIKSILVLLFILFSVKIFIYICTNKKETNYKIDNFNIKEIYTKNNNYYIEIKYKKASFNFISDYNYHKKSKIVDDILYLKNKNIICIYPIFKKEINSEIICKKDNEYYSYYSIKDNEEVKKFVKNIKKKYSFNDYNNSNQYKEYNNIKIYYNNLNNNYKYIIWNYTGIDVIDTNKKYNSINLTKKDIYNNNLGILIDKYYIIPNYNNNFNFNEIIEINLNNLKENKYKLNKEISFDTYINGIKDNNIYLMDKDNLIQYTYNIKKHSLQEVGNKRDGAVIYNNNKKEKTNIYNLRKNNIYFQDEIKLDKLKDKYNIQTIHKYLNRYYFITEDERVYLTYEENIYNPIFLFKIKNIKEMKIINDDIFFISEDNLYYYNRYNGLKIILNKNEFKYNYKNIYEIYQKRT